jgi:hypothetical protein
LGVKSGYNKAVEDQAAAGVESAKITAAATVAAAQAYSAAKERGASATEAAARAYAAAKKRGASAQEAVAAEQKAAAKFKATSNEEVARIQGKNAGKDRGGYSAQEGVSLLNQAFQARGFSTPGEAAQYLISRGVKEDVAKRAAGQFWKVQHAQ